MPRPKAQIPITQTHLERIDTNHWRLNMSDGVLFFPATKVFCYIIGRKTLERLQKQIDKELKD